MRSGISNLQNMYSSSYLEHLRTWTAKCATVMKYNIFQIVETLKEKCTVHSRNNAPAGAFSRNIELSNMPQP